jgi:thymidylate synthase (FAD)
MKLHNEVIASIVYESPEVYIIHETGIGASEYAARTCYDSFDKSENHEVVKANELLNNGVNSFEEEEEVLNWLCDVTNINHSNLLDNLAWVHFHHSVLEHSSITYLIKGISRGVLQELARHRIASYSVRSTRYTMQNILNIYIASAEARDSRQWFVQEVKKLNMFVIKGDIEELEIKQMYNKLLMHESLFFDKSEFVKLCITKDTFEQYTSNSAEITADECLEFLNNTKTKRNVGDAFKWLVTDNWKTDLVMTMNLRSLKNFLQLRDSGAAYFQIRTLAKTIKEATPSKYIDLVVKPV